MISVTILGKAVMIGRNAFRNCWRLQYIIAPNTPITKFHKEIRYIVFRGYIRGRKKRGIVYPDKVEKSYLKYYENNKEWLRESEKNNVDFREFLEKYEVK